MPLFLAYVILVAFAELIIFLGVAEERFDLWIAFNLLLAGITVVGWAGFTVLGSWLGR